MINNIKDGDRLEITLIRENDLGKTYISQVEKRLDKSRLLVSMPISYGQLVKLPISEAYSMLFFTEKGMLRFDANIENYVKEDGFFYMVVKLTSSGNKIQRRDFFRFSCYLPIKFCISTEEGEEQTEMVDGIIKDIGGGGVRFISNFALDENVIIKSVVLLENDFIINTGKVLEKRYFPKSNYSFQYRVQFISISKEDQEKIVQFVFNEQRKVINKIRITTATEA